MYDLENQLVYLYFVRFTFEVIHRGFKNYSAKSIMERIRWETDQAEGEGWKINNDFTSFYARKFMACNPQYSGFFRLREQVSKSKPALNLGPLIPEDFPYGNP
jgi:hypothetical protein